MSKAKDAFSRYFARNNLNKNVYDYVIELEEQNKKFLKCLLFIHLSDDQNMSFKKWVRNEIEKITNKPIEEVINEHK